MEQRPAMLNQTMVLPELDNTASLDNTPAGVTPLSPVTGAARTCTILRLDPR